MLLEKVGLVGQKVTFSVGLEPTPPRNGSINAIDHSIYALRSLANCDLSLQATRKMRGLALPGGTVAMYHDDLSSIPSYSQSLADWWRADGRFIVEDFNR